MKRLGVRLLVAALLMSAALIFSTGVITGKLHPEIIKFKDVTFNHEKHATSGMKCTVCHPKVFVMKRGANKITMPDIYQGRFCGSCHDGTKGFDIRNCGKCHPGMKVPGKITYPEPVLGSVTYSHEAHLANSRLTCSSCHMKPFAMKAHTAPLRMRHMYDGLYCGKCHNGREAFGLNRCSSCHSAVGPYGGRNRDGTVGYRGGRLGRVVYSHRTHRQFVCKTCHPSPFAMKGGASGITMAKMYRGESCGQCHNGAKAFSARNCVRCHTSSVPGELTYVNKAAGNSHFSHKLHATKGLKCFDCHDLLFKMKKGSSMADMEGFARGRGCGACHNGGKAFSLRSCRRCHERKNIETIQYNGGKLSTVTFSHNAHFGRTRSCKACHPAAFKMKKGANDLSMDHMSSGKGCGTCHNGVKTFSPDRCSYCHASRRGETLRIEEPIAGPVSFTHGDHFRREKSCGACHPAYFKPESGKNKVTMKEIDEGKSCGACHNGINAFRTGDCSLCHDGASAIGGGDIEYPGPSMGKVPFSHNLHRDRGIHCQECHDGIFKRKKGSSGVTMDGINDKKFCGVCHNGTRAFDASDCAKCHVQQ
jgi:c(7)-type cytochrome triheme protein